MGNFFEFSVAAFCSLFSLARFGLLAAVSIPAHIGYFFLQKRKVVGVYEPKWEIAEESLRELWKIYEGATALVEQIGDPSLKNSLDEIHGCLVKLEELKGRGGWKQFDEGKVIVKEELERLLAHAQSLRSSKEENQSVSDRGFYDPWKVLRVSKDMTNEKIKEVWRDLCKIYHPDGGKVKDDAGFKEVNEAYEKIKKERGFS